MYSDGSPLEFWRASTSSPTNDPNNKYVMMGCGLHYMFETSSTPVGFVCELNAAGKWLLHHWEDWMLFSKLCFEKNLSIKRSDGKFTNHADKYECDAEETWIDTQIHTAMDAMWTHFTNDFPITIQFSWNFILLQFHCWWSYGNKILHILRQHSCRATCQI